jgi:hypothetical protein
MHTKTSVLSRIAIIAAVTGAVALVSACAIDPTGPARSGPSGGLGTSCECPNSSADCDAAQGQCQSGLACRRLDNGKQLCTRDCGTGLLACPGNYLCKEVGILGGRLQCQPET